MEYHSKQCDQHIKPVQMMVVAGKVVCPRCELDKENQRLEAETQQYFNNLLENDKYNTLCRKSLVDDRTLCEARIDNYNVVDAEERENKRIVEDCIERYKQGQIFNVILQGNQGAGKSHLGYSMLYELNETKNHSCLFVSVEAMLRRIKGSFNNKESKYTEEYFVDLLSKVDFLVLDDLGAETGAIDTNKTATDFVQRVLYAVTTVRQHKATIVTTNLGSKTLYTMYDKKLISRLFRNPKFIVFKDTKDKRTSQIPF
jgi:DNA replication protein DnaC